MINVGMKKIVMIVLYWVLAVFIIAFVLWRAGLSSWEPVLMALLFIPGCITLKFILPKISFRNLRELCEGKSRITGSGLQYRNCRASSSYDHFNDWSAYRILCGRYILYIHNLHIGGLILLHSWPKNSLCMEAIE